MNVSVGAVRWFALQVRANHEKTVAAMLHGKAFEQFLPLYRVKHNWSDRVKNLELPLFPGYLFCRFDPMRRTPILTVPGVVRIVSVGKSPAPIDDAEISAVQAVVASGRDSQPCPFLKLGQKVLIYGGPLTGVEGILTQTKSRKRVIVSVTLLQRSVAVDVDEGLLRVVD